MWKKPRVNYAALISIEIESALIITIVITTS
ncbi:hypothetical protein BBR47_31520 [Brevibacillus brevis NBRC 100599]|uniref:Uncharacterized protein n=1 Tax=Brevibacillus brevis (strain 47 / JCM 6285 / NBRC 100599) TaxID=358681 RepID=C0ZEC0_BREBN|nr:hypothetical protein BBR47_31520 [Brevibacillus brevis NBRC 100599]